MKVDVSVWENKNRLVLRIYNLGTMIMSLSATNGLYMVYNKQWIMLGINLLFFLTIIPLFISYSKWKKMPPKYES